MFHGMESVLQTTLKAALPTPGRKRAQILKELRHQIAVKGVQGLTMRGLAASSGVATRTLFNLFGSKDALICDSLKSMDHDVHVIIVANSKVDADPLGQLIDYIEVATGLIKSEPGYSNAMIYAYYSPDPSLLGFHRYFHDFKKAMFADILSEMQRPGELREWVSIDLLARRIVETHISVVAEWTRGIVTDDELVDSALFAVLTIMIGHVGSAYEKRVIARLSALGRALKKTSRSQPAKRTTENVGDRIVRPITKLKQSRGL
jgi:Bacterial regulatory proteins, tetR family